MKLGDGVFSDLALLLIISQYLSLHSDPYLKAVCALSGLGVSLWW